MMFCVILFVALFCNALAVDPQLAETFTYETTAPASDANYIDVTLNVYPESGTISQLEIQDASGNPSCTFDYTSTTGDQEFQFRINTNTVQFTDQASSPTGVSACYVTGSKASGDFTFVIRFRTVAGTDDPADKKFTISPAGTNVVARINRGEFVTPPVVYPTHIPISLATYDAGLSILDSSKTAVTTLSLGDTFYIRFEWTVDPYKANLEYACATVYSCITDIDNTFTNKPRTIIGSNGCGTGVFLTEDQPATYGFALEASSVSVTKQTYTAITPATEMKGYTQEIATGNNELHFRCRISPAYDVTDTSAGKCGGEHCNPSARRRRDTTNSTTVTASVSIRPGKEDQEEEDECDCEDSLLVYGSAGGLGVIAVTCFIVMVLTFINVNLSTTSGNRSSRRRGSSSNPNQPPLSFIGDMKNYKA